MFAFLWAFFGRNSIEFPHFTRKNCKNPKLTIRQICYLHLILMEFVIVYASIQGGHHPIWKNGILHKRTNTRTMVMVFVLRHRHLIMGSISHYSTNKETTKNFIVSGLSSVFQCDACSSFRPISSLEYAQALALAHCLCLFFFFLLRFHYWKVAFWLIVHYFSLSLFLFLHFTLSTLPLSSVNE